MSGMTKKISYIHREDCRMVQWSCLHLRDGKPACPSCGWPAEMVVGFMGNACWVHKQWGNLETLDDPCARTSELCKTER